MAPLRRSRTCYGICSMNTRKRRLFLNTVPGISKADIETITRSRSLPFQAIRRSNAPPACLIIAEPIGTCTPFFGPSEGQNPLIRFRSSQSAPRAPSPTKATARSTRFRNPTGAGTGSPPGTRSTHRVHIRVVSVPPATAEEGNGASTVRFRRGPFPSPSCRPPAPNDSILRQEEKEKVIYFLD